MVNRSKRPHRRQQQQQQQQQLQQQPPQEFSRPPSRRGWFMAFACSWGGFVASIVFVSSNLSACSLMSITDGSDASPTTNTQPTTHSLLRSAANPAEAEVDVTHDMKLGILSQKPPSFFQNLQEAVDKLDLTERCHRFGFDIDQPTPNSKPQQVPRRIFYGALIADEPWELLDIIAKETHGIFAGMVFVESNRTQDCFHREWQHAYKEESTQKLTTMFGTNVQVRPWLNDDLTKRDLTRENLQRQEILRGWKAMGMQPNDIGLLSDVDETFSRDFLRAMQYCPYIKEFDYEMHQCDHCIAKIRGAGKVFEASPNCITQDRQWLLPDAVMGACLEEIGDESIHPRAERQQYGTRQPGWGDKCGGGGPFTTNVPGGKFPLFNAADYRFLPGGRNVATDGAGGTQTHHSAFHFHNFFANFTKTRFKYYTYGHALPTAMTDRLEDIQEDLRFMIRCLYNETDGTTDPNNFRWLVYHHPEFQRYKRIPGGIKNALDPLPIYFKDDDYVSRKHLFAKRLAQLDERQRQKNLNMTADEIRLDAIRQEQREARRIMEDKQDQAKLLEAKINATKKKQ